jgi:hypothetical protein
MVVQASGRTPRTQVPLSRGSERRHAPCWRGSHWAGWRSVAWQERLLGVARLDPLGSQAMQANPARLKAGFCFWRGATSNGACRDAREERH